MPIIDKKYEELSLKDEHLGDPLLLALAWKKSHQYIRTTNWYADNFELDLSALNLVEQCKNWADELNNEVVFKPLDLVPAPKTCAWEFVQDDSDGRHKIKWQPKPVECEKDTTPSEHPQSPVKLRPLAHIPIREQSMLSLLMMGLANKVETIQGNPSTEFTDVHKQGVVSYGNRLYCTYDADGNAQHSYGSTTIYSKYFVDYRRFLDRPHHFALEQLGEISPDERIYIVELDLEKFFDGISRQKLIEQIDKVIKRKSSDKDYDKLTQLLAAFNGWEWSSEAEEQYSNLCASDKVPTAPKGLPQGLVASGFLSNLYMLDFDREFSGKIGSEFAENKQLRLIDYCRYVDDLRLVIVGPKSFDGFDRIQQVTNQVVELVRGLDSYKTLGLSIQSDKTNVDVFHGLKVGVSKNLNEIQGRLSGPISLEEADNQLGQLESLLSLQAPPKSVVAASKNSYAVNGLASIEATRFDVREDTLKRFAANKLSKILREKRHFATQVPDENGVLQPGEWDYSQERIARRFIACWSYDPSLVLLLKKGLELFPSTKLLEPILVQLEMLLDEKDDKQVAVASYCLAEVYRHSATVIHKKDSLAFPAHADLDAYFERLQSSAAKHSVPQDQSFDLLSEQARFLMLVRADTVLEQEVGEPKFDVISKLTHGFREITLPDNWSSQDIAVAIIMANQMSDMSKDCIRSCSCLLEKIHGDIDRLFDSFKLLLVQDRALGIALVRHARGVKHQWAALDKIKEELLTPLNLETKPYSKPLNKISTKVSILRLILRDDNPFSNEIMALKLLQAVLSEYELLAKHREQSIDLAETTIEFDGFSSPVAFSVFDKDLNLTLEFNDNSHLIASWGDFNSTVSDDVRVLRNVGEFIRAVLVGNQDWTSFGLSVVPKPGYRGIRSSFYKRQLGLMTSPESISGVGSQVSGWLTGLLSKLLKWPGIRVNDHGYDWPIIWSVSAVKQLVNARLHELKTAYCTQSGIPSLLEKQALDWNDGKESLSVVMVQSKLPALKDFGEAGLMLDKPEYRAKHRRHVARVAELVLKHLEAQRVEIGSKKLNADLIIWPELAVHNDDLDVLIALSQKTKAMVFSGLGFIEQDGVKGPNNCAVWIIPTKHNTNQREIVRLQGKHNMTAVEKGKIQPWRPYQLMLELVHPAFKDEKGFIITGSICYDATDIALSSDLRNKSNAYVISALNQDVNTFDSMVEALHYHMYQHVTLVNSGEFGGSYAKAPYKDAHRRLIAHVHGNDQVSINTFEMNMFDFRRDGVGEGMKSALKKKTAPAGVEVVR
ncbi:Reverse transcriptase (RNA-dependent DNA polymerase) [Vibrio thalassae]|uniref:Reverse transcriptase (RNA-dependent DNA polymerase) n=1 Tax=Vibrio thalassae TaxID=1243014 RepID=A0A240EHG0_9VIBR|nr:RNA-directed DNA polymerase [Vibrio thalassae]SNX48104.1 Reverse transcriptase (RNA-dependent DNA polymerase) [Vibrio thalassae]